MNSIVSTATPRQHPLHAIVIVPMRPVCPFVAQPGLAVALAFPAIAERRALHDQRDAETGQHAKGQDEHAVGALLPAHVEEKEQ